MLKYYLSRSLPKLYINSSPSTFVIIVKNKLKVENCKNTPIDGTKQKIIGIENETGIFIFNVLCRFSSVFLLEYDFYSKY